MENENFIKQAKSDIFKEMQPIINFYIKKGAKPQSLRKYYKNSKRFNDLLEDIKNKGINIVRDEEEYKKIVREVLYDILEDHINTDKDEEYKNKLKHIKEFNNYKVNESVMNWILIGGAAFFVFKFLKGFFEDLLNRKNLPPEFQRLKNDIRKKIEPIQIDLMCLKLTHLLGSHKKKIKVTETYGVLTLEIDDLTIIINKLRKTLTFNKISLSGKVNKEFVDPIHLSEKELVDFENILKNNDNII